MIYRYLIAWLPIVLLPATVLLLVTNHWPHWPYMWLLAFSIFAGCKWLTWMTAPAGASWARQLGYLVAWPGMDAQAFLFTPCQHRPRLSDWLFAIGKLAFGLALLGLLFSRLPWHEQFLRGWTAMFGIAFVLHFGLFHLLSLAWRSVGVEAKPVMNWPIFASSVSDFWGLRWNTAFRDLTHRFLFRPLTARFGAKTALVIGFLVSGLLHDLIISLPAQDGYGGPTFFFLVQAGAIFFERSKTGKQLGLGRGVNGWGFAMCVLIAPAPLLFHPPFVEEIVLPFVEWVVPIR